MTKQFVTDKTTVVRNIPQLRMDCDIYLAVVALLRSICLLSLETPDVENVPQIEDRLRHLSRSCCSFEVCLQKFKSSLSHPDTRTEKRRERSYHSFLPISLKGSYIYYVR
ncbi:hypothetical protein Taro_004587 [Colocasia esculenta]|uniref:Uncharacterized protein n=1 Tax=Colocasia esculenta TaxID=4460 RepID=A0A843TQI0_COLES|nr:hypothetical protein [Colocasia esculenta]